jgi:deoxyribose-phosphate aldolase
VWHEVLKQIDLSAVRAESDDRAVRELVEAAQTYQVYLVTVLPSQTQLARRLLGEGSQVRLGGNVGFPSGGQTTSIKAAEARELVELGCDELDMVIDLAGLLSGRLQDVQQDIAAVVESAQGRPVKAILECHYLNEDQIRQACDLAIAAGAAFVKTATGWAPTGATLANVALIKAHVGERIGIKAAGGIRDLETLLQMRQLGAERFGLSLRSGRSILEALRQKQ